jgi:hypothetical protein
MASSTVIPATNRRETRLPIDDRSESALIVLFADKAIKKDLSNHPPHKQMPTAYFRTIENKSCL